jgi:hypothetical protein
MGRPVLCRWAGRVLGLMLRTDRHQITLCPIRIAFEADLLYGRSDPRSGGRRSAPQNPPQRKLGYRGVGGRS